MKPALAQVSTLNAPLEQDIADYAAGACRAIELWFTKLESYLESHTLADVRRLLNEAEMTVPAASLQGGLLISQGDFRREAWSLFERRLVLCRDLEIGTMVVAGDIHGQLEPVDVERVHVSLVEAANKAAEHGVRLALEFQGRASLANNLQTAAVLVAECDRPNLGLCFDVFHYYTGPSKFEDLDYLTPANLFHVQLSDLAGCLREAASDADRVLPGDGDFQLAPILDVLRRIDYQGCVAIELMNPQIWQIPPLQFGEVGMTALRKILGQASMG